MEMQIEHLQLPTVELNDVQSLLDATPAVREQSLRIAASVKNQETADAAAAWCGDRKTDIDRIEGKYSLLRDFLHKAHKAVTGKIAEHVDPRKGAIQLVRGAIGTWTMEEDRKRRAEEERLAAEARKRDEDMRLEAAAKLESQGNKTLANAIIEGPSMVAPPSLGQVKTQGATVRKVWKVRMVNKRELLKFIAEKPGYENAVEVNLKWLETQARQLDGNLRMPGVEVYEDAAVSIRRSA